MKAIIFILLPFITFGQLRTEWLDITPTHDTQYGWGIGNACGEDYFLQGKIKGDLDMKGGNLEINYGYIIVEADVINVGSIVYLCDYSILELNGGTLSLDQTIEPELKIYPNPAINEINIKGIEVNQLELYDMTGRRIKHFQTFGMLHKIMIDDLETGVYILIINGYIKHKIVKQ